VRLCSREHSGKKATSTTSPLLVAEHSAAQIMTSNELWSSLTCHQLLSLPTHARTHARIDRRQVRQTASERTQLLTFACDSVRVYSTRSGCCLVLICSWPAGQRSSAEHRAQSLVWTSRSRARERRAPLRRTASPPAAPPRSALPAQTAAYPANESGSNSQDRCRFSHSRRGPSKPLKKGERRLRVREERRRLPVLTRCGELSALSGSPCP